MEQSSLGFLHGSSSSSSNAPTHTVAINSTPSPISATATSTSTSTSSSSPLSSATTTGSSSSSSSSSSASATWGPASVQTGLRHLNRSTSIGVMPISPPPSKHSINNSKVTDTSTFHNASGSNSEEKSTTSSSLFFSNSTYYQYHHHHITPPPSTTTVGEVNTPYNSANNMSMAVGSTTDLSLLSPPTSPSLPPFININNLTLDGDPSSSGINSMRTNFASKTMQLADENIALKKQLNSLLRDNAELWESKLELTEQVKSLSSENSHLINTVSVLQDDIRSAEEAKQALERRSYALNDLLDGATDSQKVLQTETEILVNDLSKCRMQKSTLMTQLSTTLEEVSILSSEISAVKEKNYHLLQQLASLTSPSPQEVVKSLSEHSDTSANNPAPPYFLVHQFRRLKQKKQLLQLALASNNPVVLRDVVITLRMGLSDLTFATLISPFPEARDLYISYTMSLGPSSWPNLLPILSYFNMPYEEGMLRLRMALMEPEHTARLAALHSCVSFFTSHECLQWECERLLEHINQISD